MRIIMTDEVDPFSLNRHERDWAYNGTDCAVTAEVYNVLHPELDNISGATYAFSKALQGPCMEMGLRGVKVDQARKAQVIDELYETLDLLETRLERMVVEGVGLYGFNWRSPADLRVLFYDRLGIPEMKFKGKVTVNRGALEKIENYFVASQIVKHMIALRDIAKKIGFLKTGIDPDGRIRTQYNIAGTDTGRLSSSSNMFGSGTNLQNVEESLRSIMVADQGMKFAKFDAKSGESFCVGAIEWNLFQDGRYLDVCETGDPHTATAKLCWDDLPWIGDLKKDKDYAEETLFYRHYSYRFMCKKLGHGSNYGGQAHTLATQSKIEKHVVEDFQEAYFGAFPAHQQWHRYIRDTLQEKGYLISLLGRRRHFFGRRDDPRTFRAALAYDPQGSLADIVNTAMLNIWRQQTAQLVMNDHDALTFQYPEEIEDDIIPVLQSQLPVPVPLSHDRELVIPYDCKVGWNKGNWSKKNLDGLKDYVVGDKRKRSKEMHILDRKLR